MCIFSLAFQLFIILPRSIDRGRSAKSEVAGRVLQPGAQYTDFPANIDPNSARKLHF
jgi:hypothetical protein